MLKMKSKAKRPNSLKHKLLNDTQTKAFRALFSEFCSNSSIHGVRYFAEEKRHWSERCWWIIAFSVSLCLCGLSIRNIWMKWHDNPVTISFTEKKVPVSAIPFPTVTICPRTKVYKDKLDLNEIHLSLHRNLTSDESSRASALVHLCPRFYVPGLNDGIYTNGSIYQTIKGMSPRLSDTIFSCGWDHNLDDCRRLFAPVFTDFGLCFAYNSLNARDVYTEMVTPELLTVQKSPFITNWSIEKGYKDSSNKQSYPKRVFNSAQDAGLKFSLQSYEKDLEYLCEGTFQGFQIFLHPPGERIKASKHSFRVAILEEAEIAIKPTLIITDPSLRYYSPSERKCFFNSERQLFFFKVYSQQNCEVECLSNFTLKECGCVKFSMPRKAGDKICGTASVDCYRLAQRKLFEDDIIEGLVENSAQSFREKCSCLPGCVSISYSADIDRVRYNWLPFLKWSNLSSENFSGMRPSTVGIFFREQEVILLKRVEVYTYTDFVAICGGLLGLFLGASVLSVVEFLYYSTLRLYWTLRKWKSESRIVPLNRTIFNRVSIDIPKIYNEMYKKNEPNPFKRPFIPNWYAYRP